jgi:MFS family permease
MEQLLSSTWRKHLGPVRSSILRSRSLANKSSLNAIQNVGQLVSLPFCAFACDYFGRKKTLGFGACIILLGTGLQGGAQNSEFEICHCKPKNAI